MLVSLSGSFMSLGRHRYGATVLDFTDIIGDMIKNPLGMKKWPRPVKECSE